MCSGVTPVDVKPDGTGHYIIQLYMYVITENYTSGAAKLFGRMFSGYFNNVRCLYVVGI